MALTKEDLQAIGELISQSEHRVITHVNAVLETEVNTKIKLLAEGQGDIVKRLDTLEAKVDRIQESVEILELVVKNP